MLAMELTGAERAAAWLGVLFAVGILMISVDLLTGGRLLGWSDQPSETEAADSE